MRNKMIELISKLLYAHFHVKSNVPNVNGKIFGAWVDVHGFADDLIANGATLQTTPISYERLLHIARQMHLWIFLNCADEQKVYDELKITAEENVVFGYGGKLEITMPETTKENE